MGGDGAGDFVGALGGHGDVEVEEFVDPALLLAGGVGEVLGGLVGQVSRAMLLLRQTWL